MISSQLLIQYALRFLLILVLSVVAVWLVSEAGLMLQNENTARAPQEVILTIPAGTAARVAAGEDPPSIPDEMTFVVGDTLVVVNNDVETHTLGPLVVPANGSANMRLDEADNIALACSFNSSRYFGLNVKLPTTLRTRLLGIAFAAPPTAVMLFVYSLIVFPVKPAAAVAAGKSGS
ncbi:MAG: hypothetical protein WD751_05705 [Anaerolineales bacterium]